VPRKEFSKPFRKKSLSNAKAEIKRNKGNKEYSGGNFIIRPQKTA
jgi:hypothetical protein